MDREGPYLDGYTHGENDQLDRLASKLNKLRDEYLKRSREAYDDSTGPALTNERRNEAIGALKAIDAIASEMGLKTRTEYYN